MVVLRDEGWMLSLEARAGNTGGILWKSVPVPFESWNRLCLIQTQSKLLFRTEYANLSIIRVLGLGLRTVDS